MDETAIIDSLGRLKRAGDLPSRVAKQVEAVHTALARPKRVTVMGPPGSGKLDLMALLAGNRVVDAGLPLGTIRLVYGETASSRVVLRDGNVLELDGLPSAPIIGEGVIPVETTITAPLPALKKVSLMRLAEVNDIQGQIKAMSWAAARSDIVIWCTTKFLGVEAKMWGHMPDRMRDHAFALMTSLDGQGGDVGAATAALADRAGDDFAFVLACDLKVALSAQISVPVDRDAMKAAGGTKLISTLLKEIDRGRQNALDQAELILSKHPAPDDLPEEVADLPVAEAGAQRSQQDAPDATSAPVRSFDVPPSPEPAWRVPVDAEPQTAAATPVELSSDPDDDTHTPEAAIRDLAEVLGGQAERSAPAKGSKRKRVDPNIFPTFELAPEADEDPDDTALGAQNDEVMSAALAKIASDTVAAAPASLPALSDSTIGVCQDMVLRLTGLGTDAPEDRRDLFNAGLETLSWMDDALMGVANDDGPRVARLQQMTEEATDLIQLLKLEDNETAALDAVTILLQMKRNVHAVLAA